MKGKNIAVEEPPIISVPEKEPEIIKVSVPILKAPTIIGKIDLSSMNMRTKPKKKSKEELKEEKAKRLQAEKMKRQEAREKRQEEQCQEHQKQQEEQENKERINEIIQNE